MARSYKLKTTTRSRLGIDYAKDLNEEQRSVAFAPGEPLLVLAGAGSGKTRALTYRVARLIDTGTPAEGIVLLTFTNRAAREMTARCEELCGPTSRQIRGGTFHHVGHSLLRQYAELIGYEPNFTILDRDDAREVMAKASIDAGPAIRDARFPKPDVLLETASHAINTQQSVADVLAEKAPRYFHLAEEVEAVCRGYIERKVSMNVMDFDDLLMNWKVLLEECGEIAEVISSRTRAILVDEYQDTNVLQAQIVDLMAKHHRNVTVVGDDAQCIYGFRGAEVENMLSFGERYKDARILPLTVNYRSTPEILSLANASLERAETGFDKRLTAIRQSGPTPALIPCRDVTMQAEFVAQRVLEQIDEGIALDEICVLYRAHSHALEIQVEFTRRGIPFVVRSGLRFFEQAHIKDITAHLKLIYNVTDELAFMRAAKLQEGVGNSTADTLWHAFVGEGEDALVRSSDLGLRLEQAAGKRAKQGVRRFFELLQELSTKKMRALPGEMIRTIVEVFYGDYLESNYPNGAERKDDIEQLADYASGYGSLEEFLQELALVTDFSVEEAVAADDNEPSVTLSSVHQAKGLEWSRVFLVWLSEGRFPSDLALRDPDGAEEERRLFYVAVTRAKDELNLTYPQVHRGRDSAQVLMRRSRFIEELPDPEPLSEELQTFEGQTAGLYEVWQIEELPADEEEEIVEVAELPAMPPPPQLKGRKSRDEEER